MKIDATQFWLRIDEIRKLKGLSISKICELDTSLVYKTITQQRNRNIIPNADVIVSFANVLGTSIDYLVTGKEYEYPLLKQIHNNEYLLSICTKLTQCSQEHLNIIDTMLDSWGYPIQEKVKSKVLA